MVSESKIIDFSQCPVTLNSCMLIIGMRKSGKTTLLRAIIHRLLEKYSEEIYGIWVYSKTAFVNREDYDFTDKLSLIDTKEVERHLIKQEQIKILSKEDQRVKPKNVVIVLDDFVSDIPHAAKVEGRVLETIATMGRHYNITCIILSQRYSKISTTVRDNSNYIFCTSISQESLFSLYTLQTDYNNRQLMWQDYNSFTKENQFSFMMMQKENPRAPNVYFVKACPFVQFIDLNDLEENNSAGDDTCDDQTSLSDDLVKTG